MELTIQLGGAHEGPSVQVQVAQRTDIGNRTENQDAVGHKLFGDWLVCVLADGAGGHRGGAFAAILAVEMSLSAFEQCPTLDKSRLLQLIRHVNQNILHQQTTHPDYSDMHTTICMLVINQRSGQAAWLHVGDSRVYHFHHTVLRSRTKDHSVLQWMTDHQQCDGRTSRNALYTALGEQADQLQIEVTEPCSLSTGDWFLMCSDGLWEHLSDDELALLGTNLWCADDCNTHIHQLAFNRALGRSDNLSSILVFLGEGVAQSG
jgi:serine/threonine protein phosphatase PrpC